MIKSNQLKGNNSMKNTSNNVVLTLAQYKEFCSSYFEEKQKQVTPEFKQLINKMSYEDYSTWQRNFFADIHNIAREPIKNYVSFVRGDYDPLNFKEDRQDPLRKPENQELLDKYVAVYEEKISDFLKRNSFISEKSEGLVAHQKALAEEASMNIVVEDKKFRAIKKLPILWEGWECDSTAWIVEDEGQKKLVMSNHGSLYFADKDELKKKIQEYKDVLSQTQEAFDMMDNTAKRPKP